MNHDDVPLNHSGAVGDQAWPLFCLLAMVAVVLLIRWSRKHGAKRAAAVQAEAPSGDLTRPAIALDSTALKCLMCGLPASHNLPLVSMTRPVGSVTWVNPLRVVTDTDAPHTLCHDHEAVKRAEAERFIAQRAVDALDQRATLARALATFNAAQSKPAVTP